MKKTILISLLSCILWAPVLYAQTTYYVATNGGSVSPYTSWANAATNIHDAVALAGNNDTVLISNGLFRLTNQITLTTGVTVRSLYGPGMTTVYRDPGAGAIRLFMVSNVNAVVAGLTVTNGDINSLQGSTLYLADGMVSNCVIAKCASGSSPYGITLIYIGGGLMTGCLISNNTCRCGALGVYATGIVEDSRIVNNTALNSEVGGVRQGGGVVRRCRIAFNSGGNYTAGGVYFLGGRMENCLIYGNTANASAGAGVQMTAAGTMLVNCTITGNWAPLSPGCGVYRSGGVVTNCIIYGNGADTPNDNYYGSTSAVWYSCSPDLTAGVQGNVSLNPRFVDVANNNYRLMQGSPCLDAGTNLPGITEDMDRRSRPLVAYAGSSARHDMGAYEKDGANGALEVGFAGTPATGLNSVTSVFSAVVSGSNTTITVWAWDFDNNGVFDSFGSATMTNVFGPGRYSVVVRVTNSVGETAVVTNSDYVLVSSANIYVSPTGSNVVPYASWADAATNLNDAAQIALAGSTVWVTNGSYRLTNQISVFFPLAIRSINGPDVTTVWRAASAGNFRIFDLRDAGASVAGFTMTNGYLSGQQGSGFNMIAGTLSNCVIAKCTAAGVWMTAAYLSGGLMTHCVVSNNIFTSGGPLTASGGVIEDCTIITNTGVVAGGLQLDGSAVARRCRITKNSSTWGYGPGGVCFNSGGRLENSLVFGNTTVGYNGGGVYMKGGSMVNCTVAGNVTSKDGGGVSLTGGTITNCIIYRNTASPSNNYAGPATCVWYSCASELIAGEQGNITSDPLFVNANSTNYHLRSGSLCINKGITLAGMGSQIDLDRNPRVMGGKVDMGVYEAAFLGTIFMIH
jgi:hypothetical protein